MQESVNTQRLLAPCQLATLVTTNNKVLGLNYFRTWIGLGGAKCQHSHVKFQFMQRLKQLINHTKLGVQEPGEMHTTRRTRPQPHANTTPHAPPPPPPRLVHPSCKCPYRVQWHKWACCYALYKYICVRAAKVGARSHWVAHTPTTQPQTPTHNTATDHSTN